jgi:hypothetical protein
MLKMPDEFINKGRPTNYVYCTLSLSLSLSYPPSLLRLSLTHRYIFCIIMFMCLSFQITDRLNQVTDCQRNWYNHHANIGALHLCILEFPTINYANMVAVLTRMAGATLDPLVTH